MKTLNQLRKEAKALRINLNSQSRLTAADKPLIARQIATGKAQKVGLDLPPCYGILYLGQSAHCRVCKVSSYCEVSYAGLGYGDNPYYDPELVTELTEDDTDSFNRTGFKEGSRPALLIRRWGKKKLSEDDLKRMMKDMFKSDIDLERILKRLKQRKLLVVEGMRYAVRR